MPAELTYGGRSGGPLAGDRRRPRSPLFAATAVVDLLRWQATGGPRRGDADFTSIGSATIYAAVPPPGRHDDAGEIRLKKRVNDQFGGWARCGETDPAAGPGAVPGLTLDIVAILGGVAVICSSHPGHKTSGTSVRSPAGEALSRKAAGGRRLNRSIQISFRFRHIHRIASAAWPISRRCRTGKYN